jgi:arginine decarboxylase
MMALVPEVLFFTKGVGLHKEKLTSFEMALRAAGIAAQNLVTVSSIVPPRCRIVTRSQGVRRLQPGQITFCVLAQQNTNEPNRLVSATVGMALPEDRNTHGYLSEHHAYGESAKVSGFYGESLAVEMLASTQGLAVEETRWDARTKRWRLRERPLVTKHVSVSAFGEPTLWVTVVAVGVFCG